MIMKNYRQYFIKVIILILLSTLEKAAYAQDSTQTENRWEDVIQKFEQNDKTAPPPENGILFVGSSSFTMWEDLKERFPDKKVFNRGFGGSQLSDVIQYADRIIMPYQPAQVIVYEGDNDIASGKSPAQFMTDVKTLVKMIEKELPQTQIAFVSVKPSLARWNLKEKYEKANRKLKKYAQKKDNVEFVDVWNPMLNEEGQPIADIFLEDGLHMNKQGYDIWAEVIAPHLK